MIVMIVWVVVLQFEIELAWSVWFAGIAAELILKEQHQILRNEQGMETQSHVYDW